MAGRFSSFAAGAMCFWGKLPKDQHRARAIPPVRGCILLFSATRRLDNDRDIRGDDEAGIASGLQQDEMRMAELDPEKQGNSPGPVSGIAHRHSRYLNEYQNLKAEVAAIDALLKNM